MEMTIISSFLSESDRDAVLNITNNKKINFIKCNKIDRMLGKDACVLIRFLNT